MSRDLFVYHLCIDSCEKGSNKRESLLLKVKHIVKESKRQIFMKYYQMVSIHGLAHLKYKLLKVLLQGFMGNKIEKRHTLVS